MAARPQDPWSSTHETAKWQFLLPLPSQGSRPSWTWLLTSLLLSIVSLLVPSLAHGQEASPPPTGLVTRTESGKSQALPLISESIEVHLDGYQAETRLEQTFQNETTERLEGTYRIQLAQAASAKGFSYFVGSERIVGEVFEREAATAIYQEVSGSGRDPGLLEATGEGQFQFAVAPILPSEKKRVLVSLAQPLTFRGTHFEYQFPLSERSTARIHLPEDVPLSDLSSPTHELASEDGSPLKIATLRRRPGTQGFLLHIRNRARDYRLEARFHKDPGQAAFVSIALATPASTNPTSAPRDVTLVLDRSGSMSGGPLLAAKQAAISVLERLPKSDRVNIIAFDDGVEALFDQPRSVDEARSAARSFIEKMSEGGGTDIALALKAAAERLSADGRPKVVLFLTDGQSNSQAALTALPTRPDLRLFTVGMGSGVDKALLKRLAREHRGRFVFVESESRVGIEVDTLYQSISRPLLTDLRIEVKGTRFSSAYPRSLPDLFAGSQVEIRGRLEFAKEDVSAEVILHAKQGNQDVAYRTTVMNQDRPRPWVGRAWAESRVEDLLETMALEGPSEELKNEVISLGLAFDLVTEYTAFLAIPESEVTGSISGTLEAERARKAQILKNHPDAAALSRSLMPPGDPIISVNAPEDAKAVVAVFPFGLTLDLSFSSNDEKWLGRFLVPQGVTDGVYQVRVYIVEKSGLVTETEVAYTIDSQAPVLTHEWHTGPDGLTLELRSADDLGEVRAVDASSDQESPLALTMAPDQRHALVHLGIETKKVRVVAADKARNETVLLLIAPEEP